MREITTHVVEGDAYQNQLQLRATDEPGSGGANHRYEVSGFNTLNNDSSLSTYDEIEILFQNGSIADKGVNGLTQEVLLAIIIDRLKAFSNGPYPSKETACALTHLQEALMWLQQRTRDRIARGVEGKYVK